MRHTPAGPSVAVQFDGAWNIGNCKRNRPLRYEYGGELGFRRQRKPMQSFRVKKKLVEVISSAAELYAQ